MVKEERKGYCKFNGKGYCRYNEDHKLHNEFGPAIVGRYNGKPYWYLQGKPVSPKNMPLPQVIQMRAAKVLTIKEITYCKLNNKEWLK